MKKYLLITALLIGSFLMGFIINSILTSPDTKPFKAGNMIIPKAATKKTDRVEEPSLDQETKKKYYILLAEYITYTKEHDQSAPISFDEFIAIRRDKLVQEGKYSEQDESLDNKITDWYNKTDVSENHSIEKSTYSISGDILNTNDLYAKKTSTMVMVYSNQTQHFLPGIPVGHILPEVPVDYSFLDAGRNDFEFKIDVPDNDDAIFISAMTIPKQVPYNSVPSMIGTDKTVNGVPISILSKRKNNEPIQIKLKTTPKDMDHSNLTINNITKNSIVSVYAFDLINKIQNDVKISKTTISSADNVARLSGIPSGALFLITSDQINNNGYKKNFCFEGMAVDQETIITLPETNGCDDKKTCLLIIRPNNIGKTEISIYSKTSKFAKTKALDGDMSWYIDNVPFKDGILELKAGNESLGLMKISTTPSKITIIEPRPKRIDLFIGNIKKISSSTQSEIKCSGCTASIKLSEKQERCDRYGRFEFKDISLIDNYINIDIDDKDVASTINILSIYPQSELLLESAVPSRSILNIWNLYVPTTPDKSIVYGEFPYYKSYKAFLVSIGSDGIKEAVYFNRSNLPDRKMYSTDYLSTSPAFGKFMFNDVKDGRYALYLISGNELIHSRNVYVEKERTLVIN